MLSGAGVGVDIPTDAGVGVAAAEQLAVDHARQDQVVGVASLAGHLGPGVDLGQGLTDDTEGFFHARPPTWLMRSAASSTASRIFV